MAYRRREHPITKTCKKCKSSFETWHIGRIYCGQACNMTAWRHRHKKKSAITEDKTTPAKDNLAFSLPNIATIATGSLAATAATSLLSNEPSQAQIVEMLKVFMNAVGNHMGRIAERVNQINDFNEALGDEFIFVKSKAKAITDRRHLIEQTKKKR